MTACSGLVGEALSAPSHQPGTDGTFSEILCGSLFLEHRNR